jgi:hypothetical protein
MLISEPRLMAALARLENSPAELGNAVYRQVKAERMLKHVKALQMAAHNTLPVNAQEREAYSSKAYLEALEEEAISTADLAKTKAEIEAAKLIVDVWRTEESSARQAAR